MNNQAYAALYYGVQRLCGGVSPDMVRHAERLLALPSSERREKVLARLRDVHGGDITWTSLTQRPVVERTTLVEHARELAERAAGGRGMEVRKTSGSSGTPFLFPKDRVMTAWMDAAMWAVYAWHGVAPGDPHARFWGAPVDPRQRWKQRRRDRLLHRRRISAFELSFDTVEEQFRLLRGFRPSYAYGYPTLMRAFADLCRQQGFDGQDLGLRVVISTGEVLSPSDRKAVSDFFGCRVVNEYGCTESGIIGFECENGSMHTVPVAVWPEVVDAGGEPVGAGEEGEVIISDLYGSTLPLLRYRLHDRARPGARTCPCGRDLPTLDVTSGRSDSFIQTPRGPIYDAILAYTVHPAVQRFRARQVAPDRLVIEVVPGVAFDPTRTRLECEERWLQALGPGMTVEVQVVPDVPVELSGKLRYFIPLGQ